MERRRRIGAYGLCRDQQGRVLLVRAGAGSVRPGTWFLPGGGLQHGEHPARGVLRELAEETGLTAEVVGVRDVVAEVVARPPGLEHTDGVVYDLEITGGTLRPEPDGSSDRAQWFDPAEAAGLPLSRVAAGVLGLPPPAEPGPRPPGGWRTEPAPGDPGRRRRGQRFAVYGWATDPGGRVLLTQNAAGYPGAGLWHPPGGGTDFGEQPRDGLLREIAEETSQHCRVTELIAVTDYRNPAALGPEGYPIDWHAVRVLFRVQVDRPAPPVVSDHGGSTAQAGWFDPAAAAELPLTDLAAGFLAGQVDRGRNR